DDQSNNRRLLSDAVVVALVDLGLSKRIANELAKKYGSAHIAEKIDFLTFLQETAPDKVANPRGWLRKAIEEDYGPPDGYRSAAQRAAEAQRQHEQQVQLA